MYYWAILETMNDLLEKASTNIFNRLSWHTGLKDQAAIAADLASGKDIQAVYGLGEAGLFDEFFCFLDEIGISSLFESLAPNSHSHLSPAHCLRPQFLLAYRAGHSAVAAPYATCRV